MAGLYTKILSLATCLLTVSAVLLHSMIYALHDIWARILCGIATTFLLSSSMVYFWMWTQSLSRRQSLRKATTHFLLNVLLTLRGRFVMQKCLDSCQNPLLHQERLFRNIIQQNRETAYGRKHRLTEITSMDEYRKRHPLTDYERIRPFVDRMIHGEKDVLVQGVVHSFNKTTGTTGKSKYIPVERGMMFKKFDIGATLTYISTMSYETGFVRKCMYFYVSPAVKTTDKGYSIEPVGRLPRGHDWFMSGWAAPPAAFDISKLHEAIYVQLLFGLLDPTIDVMFANFLSFLERAVKIIESSWKTLLRDVAKGTLNAELDIPKEVRDALTTELLAYGGDPARAADLRREFEKGFQGLFKRIWPSMRYILGIDATGAWSRISRTFAEGLTLSDVGYGSTESVLAALRAGPKIVSDGYILLVDYLVFEFIKEGDISEEQPSTHFVNDVVKGERYEVVITRENGLYRYRTGDVVCVVDFYKNMPLIKFLYRTGQLLNLIYEKIDQIVVLESVRAAAAQWPDASLVEFVTAESFILSGSCTTDQEELAPYYLFFVELDSANQTFQDKDKDLIDVELQNRNGDYARLRREGAIARPRVYMVRSGTFEQLQHYLLDTTEASANQYKLPRKIRTRAALEFMFENVVHN